MATDDLRGAIRQLAHQPAFTAAAMLTVALGIGLTTAIFTVVDAVLLRDVPFPEPERLVVAWETDRDSGTVREPGSYPDFVDFQQRSRRLDRLAAFSADEAILTTDGSEPFRVAALSASHAFAPLLGVSPIVGRTFAANDDRPNGPAVALISDRLWERLFQRSPDVTGRTIRIDDLPRTIVGVMPPGADFGVLQILTAADYGRGFADRDPRTQVDVWLPLQADEQQFPRDTHPFLLLGRLAPGASTAAAQEELSSISAALERAYPENKARGVHLEPLDTVIFGPVRPTLAVLLAAAGLVMLIACVNVANLLLARGTSRIREVAVRSALGAGTGRLARQFVVENLVLAIVASVLAVGLAVVALRVLVVLAPPDIPRLAMVAVNARALAVALALSTLAGMAFGLVPLYQSRKADLVAALRSEDGRGTGGAAAAAARSTLVVIEMALAVMLAIGAALLVRTIWNLQRVDPGFDAHGVLKAEFQLPATRYPVDFKLWPDFREMHRFNASLLERVATLPGVTSAALAGNHPLDAGFTNSFVVVGREAESEGFPEISIRRVSPGYFRTVGARLVRGRLIADSDSTRAPAVILINQAAAARFFAGREALGQQLEFWGSRRTIVGVLADEKFHGLAEAPPLAAYVPLAQGPSANGAEALIVRTSGDPMSLASAVSGAIREVDPGLAVFGVEPLADTLSQSIGEQRFLMLLLVVFAALAVLLSAIGVHGVLSYVVVQRSREIGIRVALGAHPRGVVGLVVRQGARLALAGAVLGVLLAAMLTGVLSRSLYGVPPTDPVTFALVLAVLAVVALGSIWLPARRAAQVDPIATLRR